jgi:hypothetical protein
MDETSNAELGQDSAPFIHDVATQLSKDLGIELDPKAFEYQDWATPADFIQQVRAGDNAAAVVSQVSELREKFYGEISFFGEYRPHTELQKRKFLDPSQGIADSKENGRVLWLFKQGKINEQELLAYFAESSLYIAADIISKIKHLQKEAPSLVDLTDERKEDFSRYYSLYATFIELLAKSDDPEIRKRIHEDLQNSSHPGANMK